MSNISWKSNWRDYWLLFLLQTLLLFASFTAYLGRNRHSILWLFNKPMVHHQDFGGCAIRWQYYQNIFPGETLSLPLAAIYKQVFHVSMFGLLDSEYSQLYGPPCQVGENFLHPGERFFAGFITILTLLSFLIYYSAWFTIATGIVHVSYFTYIIYHVRHTPQHDDLGRVLNISRLFWSSILLVFTLLVVSPNLFNFYIECFVEKCIINLLQFLCKTCRQISSLLTSVFKNTNIK